MPWIEYAFAILKANSVWLNDKKAHCFLDRFFQWVNKNKHNLIYFRTSIFILKKVFGI